MKESSENINTVNVTDKNDKIFVHSQDGYLENEFYKIKNTGYYADKMDQAIKLNWLHNIGPLHYKEPGNYTANILNYSPPNEQYSDEYVNVLFTEESEAIKFIDDVLDIYGGKSNFEHDDENDHKYCYYNKMFIIGYLDLSEKFKQPIFAVDIDRNDLPTLIIFGCTDVAEKNTEIAGGVFTYNDEINEIVQGLNKVIFNKGHLAADNNFYTTGDGKKKIISYMLDYDEARATFVRICKHNDGEITINSLSDSKKIPEGISFKQKPTQSSWIQFENKSFKVTLSKGNSVFKIIIYIKADLPEKKERRRSYHSNGAIREEFELLNGVVHGTYKSFDKEGKLLKTLSYEEGQVKS